MLHFDPEKGLLQVEAGYSLDQLNRQFWEQGWAVPVSPGTATVSVGGMIAADIHGKNHHVAGSLGHHVASIELQTADGVVRELEPGDAEGLFDATTDGMGLTGHILSARLKLEPVVGPWIRRRIRATDNLDGLLEGLTEESRAWPMTVAWSDALASGSRMGRGILISGRWAESGESPTLLPSYRSGIRVPFDLPGPTLARWSVGLLNRIYYARNRQRHGEQIVPARGFFYPLDVIRDWNRAYGRRGFTQYQCVLPRDDARRSVIRLFEELRRTGAPSFLTVIKDCGAAGSGLLSFPMPGISVALDLPMVGKETQGWVDALNRVAIDCGGRIYLAKDALTRRDHFQAMESGRLEQFEEVRRRFDPDRRIRSALSHRLLDPS